jgi:predicted nuclease of predicted toxin-antitoxin system
MERTFGCEVVAVQEDPELVTARDHEIFAAAKAAGAVVMTKDRDVVDLVERLGPPPPILWITCGNTSNRARKRILSSMLRTALALIERGEVLVEISDLGPPTPRLP